MIFCTAFDGARVLPDKADPTDPQVPSSLDPAEGYLDVDDENDDDDCGDGGDDVGDDIVSGVHDDYD